MKRSKAKVRNLKHEILADLHLNSLPAGYESRLYPDDLAVFMKFKRDSSLPPAQQDDVREFRISYLVALIEFSTTANGHRGTSFFSAEKVKFSEKMGLSSGCVPVHWGAYAR